MWTVKSLNMYTPKIYDAYRYPTPGSRMIIRKIFVVISFQPETRSMHTMRRSKALHFKNTLYVVFWRGKSFSQIPSLKRDFATCFITQCGHVEHTRKVFLEDSSVRSRRATCVPRSGPGGEVHILCKPGWPFLGARGAWKCF